MVYAGHMRHKLPLYFVVPAFLMIFSCSQTAKESPPAFTDETIPEGYSFPHPANVAEPTVHGAWVLQAGTTLCISCHNTDSSTTLPGPSCISCHTVYPHSDGWVSATAGASLHGSIVSVDGSTQCESCHGTNDAGSIFSAFCNACHSQHLSSPTTCNGCHEAGKGLPATASRPSDVDKNHLTTQDCASCHDYATGDFKILRGETIDFTQSPHASTTGAFAAESEKTYCMRCHTATGFMSFIQNGTQDAAALAKDLPDPLTCAACHNADTANYGSGVTLNTSGFTPGDNPATYKRSADGGADQHIDLTVGKEGVCLKCHAPRSSDGAIKVNAWVYNMALDTAYTSASTYTFAQYPANDTATPAGKVSSSQKRDSAVTFHYVPVLATFYGNDAKEGFQYQTDPSGNALTYVGKNTLMTGYDTCVKCHNPHTTAVQPAKCVACHSGVTTSADFQNIRMTTSDYDGDGDAAEGIYSEVEGVKAKLYQAIQNYALLQRAIVFSPSSSSTAPWRRGDDTTKVYDKFTPRLIKALYNYHLAYRDTAAYVHNSKYIVELLYDSIKDLNSAPGVTQVDMTGMVRP